MAYLEPFGACTQYIPNMNPLWVSTFKLVYFDPFVVGTRYMVFFLQFCNIKTINGIFSLFWGMIHINYKFWPFCV